MPDREKVIKGLEHCGFNEKRGCVDCPYSDECGDFGRDAGMSSLATDALALLREREPVATDTNVLGKWISVKDRLPEVHFADGPKVLVAFKIYDDICGNIVDVDTAEFNKVFGGAGLDDCLARAGYNPFEVTHWMLLPKPPEELLDDTKQND